MSMSTLRRVTTSPYPKEIFLDAILLKHKCTWCNLVLQDPHQSSCGHRFCCHCLNEMSTPKCPEDMTPFKREECFPDNFAKRETRQLRVRCVIDECEWRGQLAGYDDHISQCSYVIITCEECGDKLPRGDQHSHVTTICPQRKIECKFCNIFVLAENYEKHLINECPNSLVDCPHKCGLVRRSGKEIANHLEKSECIELCLYGCEQKVPHNNLASHQEDVLLHLRELTHRVKDLESVPKQAHKVVKELESDPQQIFPSSIGEVVKDGLPSTTVPTYLATNVKIDGFSSKSENSELVSLREKVSSMERKLDVDLKTRVHDLESGSVSWTTFEELQRKLEQAEARQAQLERERKSQDDVLRQMNTLLPEFDLRLSILESTSYDGTIIWKISNFSRRYEDAASGKTHSLYSQPFFTSHYGYKMCLRLYPYGDGMGKSKHVSLFFVVMKGEYDDILDWPFQRKISFSLLNPEKRRPITDSFIPDPKSSSFKQPTNMMNIASGCPLFAPLDRIWNEGFVKNDCIFVKAIVTPI